MKKIITVILVIIMLLTATLSLVGCKQSFNAKSVMAQIDDNLHWHWGGGEACVYDVFDGDDLVGSYTSTELLLNNTDVKVTTSVEAQNATLSAFSGYAFSSELNATVDSKTYERYTQSYTDEYLSPKLSYVKTVYDGKTTEIKTVYENNRVYATFIIDGEVFEESVKSKASMLYDNAYVYQFARATDLATALSVTVPTYTVEEDRKAVSASNFSTSYSSSSTALDYKFVLERNFVDSGDTSGSSYGIEDDSHKATTGEDEEGNVTTTYGLTVTDVIPTVKVTFASTASSLVTGYIYCYISSYPMRTENGDTLANRVVVMMQEGKMTYKLKSVTRSFS